MVTANKTFFLRMAQALLDMSTWGFKERLCAYEISTNISCAGPNNTVDPLYNDTVLISLFTVTLTYDRQQMTNEPAHAILVHLLIKFE